MAASDILAFYASHSPMSEPGGASALIDPLPNDVAALARVIQGLGIYDVVAHEFYGFEAPADRLARSIYARSPSASRGSWSSTAGLCRSPGIRIVARFSAATRSRSCL